MHVSMMIQHVTKNSNECVKRIFNELCQNLMGNFRKSKLEIIPIQVDTLFLSLVKVVSKLDGSLTVYIEAKRQPFQ